jgi:hypothetical protein
MKCNTNGAMSGEIHFPLSTLFRLGLAHLGAQTTIPAAVILPGGTTEINCEGTILQMRGGMIGAFQKENGEQVELGKPFLALKLNFQQTSAGLQDLRLIVLPGGTPTTNDLEVLFFSTFELASEVANFALSLFKLSNGTVISVELVEP